MSRTLEAIRREAAQHARRREVFDSIVNGSLHGDAERLALEELRAIDNELAAMAEKAAPPAPAMSPEVRGLSPAQAAARAAEIRSTPQYWGRPDAAGNRLSLQEHDRLVAEHAALMDRASESGGAALPAPSRLKDPASEPDPEPEIDPAPRPPETRLSALMMARTGDQGADS